MSQGVKTLDEFYHEFNEISATLNQKISLDLAYEGSVPAVMHFVGEMTKNAFIDGLNEPISTYTRNYRPTNLVDAYQAAQEQTSAMNRKKQKNLIQNPYKQKNQAMLPNTNRPQNLQYNQFRNQRPAINNRQNFQQQPPQNYHQRLPGNFQQNLQQYNNPQRNFQQYNNPQWNLQQQAAPSGLNHNNSYDQSMRSRQSNQMSGISYNSGNQLNFN